MTNEIKEKLVDFILAKELKFTEGRRNTDATEISGYALFIGIKHASELAPIIEETCDDYDADYYEELNRVFDYAQDHNYGNWWKGKAIPVSTKAA